MSKDNYRPEGRYTTAQDVADRLLPDLHIHEVMLWAPDLFAYTSYLLMMTSAYQLVVSPPSRKQWQPEPDEIKAWLHEGAQVNLKTWLSHAVRDWDASRKSEVDSIVKNKVEEVNSAIKSVEEEFEKAKSIYDNDPKGKVASFWNILVEKTGEDWQTMLNTLDEDKCLLIDDTAIVGTTKEEYPLNKLKELHAKRGSKLLDIVLDHTPPLLLACWSFFYSAVTRKNFHNDCKLQITELLCNRDDLLANLYHRNRLWNVSQALLTMHAISDIASSGFGISDKKVSHESGPAEMVLI